MKIILIRLILALLFLTNISIAHAKNMGRPVQVTWMSANSTFIENIIVTPGIELPFWIAGSWDFGEDFIEYKSGSLLGDSEIYGFGKGVNWIFDGLDLSNTKYISSVTNFDGWDESNINFTSNSISIIFKNDIAFTPNEGTLRLSFLPEPPTIPEPSNSSLLIFGLFLIIFRFYNRDTKKAIGSINL